VKAQLLPNNTLRPKKLIYKAFNFIYKAFSFKSSEFLKSVYLYTKSYTISSLSGYLSALSARIYTLLVNFYTNIRFIDILCLHIQNTATFKYDSILKCNLEQTLNIYFKLYFQTSQYLYIQTTLLNEKLRNIDGNTQQK
jgi:hypothetical protein